MEEIAGSNGYSYFDGRRTSDTTGLHDAAEFPAPLPWGDWQQEETSQRHEAERKPYAGTDPPMPSFASEEVRHSLPLAAPPAGVNFYSNGPRLSDAVHHVTEIPAPPWADCQQEEPEWLTSSPPQRHEAERRPYAGIQPPMPSFASEEVRQELPMTGPPAGVNFYSNAPRLSDAAPHVAEFPAPSWAAWPPEQSELLTTSTPPPDEVGRRPCAGIQPPTSYEVRQGLPLTAPPAEVYMYQRERRLCRQCSGRGCPCCRQAPITVESAELERAESWSVPQHFPSIGSVGHATGLCRPCAHFWRRAGCNQGAFCQRCHLCTQEDFIEYRRGVKHARLMRRR
eukprot:TRINITY_DN28517_c0_g1_i1.p1 TRINITY_DN28517_c0_g1~~TRINITY_DN28517_c0_g1_i1.p1  ORF type:complete len:365 (-),score=26.20 TRINITY_DN28517_c0_g1_i1:337-1353(-)